MSQQSASKHLVRFRYSDLKQDPIVHALFEDWVTNMTMEKDGEYGRDRIVDGKKIPGFWTWIQEHDATPEFQASELYGTFVWVHWYTLHVLATGTIAPDDRGVKAEYNLGGDGLWGGVNVRSDFGLRGNGIGRKICKELDDHVAAYAMTTPRTFHLFTVNPIAEGIYTKLGYKRNPIGDIHTEAFGGERLYTKRYGAD